MPGGGWSRLELTEPLLLWVGSSIAHFVIGTLREAYMKPRAGLKTSRPWGYVADKRWVGWSDPTPFHLVSTLFHRNNLPNSMADFASFAVGSGTKPSRIGSFGKLLMKQAGGFCPYENDPPLKKHPCPPWWNQIERGGHFGFVTSPLYPLLLILLLSHNGCSCQSCGILKQTHPPSKDKRTDEQ